MQMILQSSQTKLGIALPLLTTIKRPTTTMMSGILVKSAEDGNLVKIAHRTSLIQTQPAPTEQLCASQDCEAQAKQLVKVPNIRARESRDSNKLGVAGDPIKTDTPNRAPVQYGSFDSKIETKPHK